jgi:hypothetical protein
MQPATLLESCGRKEISASAQKLEGAQKDLRKVSASLFHVWVSSSFFYFHHFAETLLVERDEG